MNIRQHIMDEIQTIVADAGLDYIELPTGTILVQRDFETALEIHCSFLLDGFDLSLIPSAADQIDHHASYRDGTKIRAALNDIHEALEDLAPAPRPLTVNDLLAPVHAAMRNLSGKGQAISDMLGQLSDDTKITITDPKAPAPPVFVVVRLDPADWVRLQVDGAGHIISHSDILGGELTCTDLDDLGFHPEADDLRS